MENFISPATDEGLRCMVCKDTFDCTEQIPRMLHCKHTVCHSCIQQLLNKEMVICPKCRFHNTCNGGIAANFPQNEFVTLFLEHIEEFKSKRAKVKPDVKANAIAIKNKCKRLEIKQREIKEIKTSAKVNDMNCKDFFVNVRKKIDRAEASCTRHIATRMEKIMDEEASIDVLLNEMYNLHWELKLNISCPTNCRQDIKDFERRVRIIEKNTFDDLRYQTVPEINNDTLVVTNEEYEEGEIIEIADDDDMDLL